MKRVAIRAALVLAIAVAALIGGAGKAFAASCSDAQVVPRIAELSVTQGAPGYARLARGKETIVRAYLTTPTACPLSTKQSISPISATLDVSYSNGATGTQQQLTNYQPLSGRLGAAQQIYSTADPFFVVPDSYLAPANNGAAFTINFTLRVTYNRNGSTTLTTDPSATPNSAASKPVDAKTNALRVLVVPMGDPTSTATQWSPTAEQTLQDVMMNAARAFPVPNGVSPSLTTTSTGGIRYVVSTTLLDAKSLGLFTNGKFCGSASDWSTSQVTTGPLAGHTLKADLLQRLADYNLQNAPPADLVLGVVDGSIAWKSTDGLGCDDGRATTPAAKVPGQVAWVRISTDSYPTPLEMELMHPFGISRASLSFHSPNVEADGGGPGKGYNVLQRKVIDLASGALGMNDHSIMNYTTTTVPYTKDNTLLEPSDWNDALCDLGGLDSAGGFTACSLNTALGTSEGVAAAQRRVFYQISGICSNSCASVRVTFAQANVSSDVQTPTGVASTSPLHLLLCTGPCSTPANVQKDVALALQPDEGHSDSGAVSIDPPDGFDAMVEMSTTWTDAALSVNNGQPMPIGSASDPPPDVTSTSDVVPGTVMRSFTPHSTDGEFTTNLCCNGRAVAFDGTNLYLTVAQNGEGGGESSHIYKTRTSDGTIIDSFGTGTTIGALAYNAGHLYGGDYTGNGNVYDIDPGNIDTGTGQAAKTTLFSFDDPGPCLGGGNFIDGLEYRPTAGNLAISGDACDTAFIKTLAGGAVSSFATHNNSGITTDGSNGLWLARVETAGHPSDTLLTHVNSSGVVAGELVIPSYDAEDLAYDSVTFAPTCVVWMNEATFGSPRVQAVAVPCGSGQGNGGKAVESTTTNTKFASVFFTCGDPSNVTDNQPTFTVANGLRPDAGGEIIANYTNQLFCGEGTPKLITEASNGWSTTGLSDQQAVQGVDATSKAPVTNIASPLNGAKVRRGEKIHYEGSAFDAEQEAITGANLKWYDDTLSPQQIGTGQSFDLKVPAGAPLGDHHIKLEATDAQGHVTSTTVTISVQATLCPSTNNCS